MDEKELKQQIRNSPALYEYYKETMGEVELKEYLKESE